MVQVIGSKVATFFGSKSFWFVAGLIASQLFAREVAEFCSAQGVSLLQGVF